MTIGWHGFSRYQRQLLCTIERKVWVIWWSKDGQWWPTLYVYQKFSELFSLIGVVVKGNTRSALLGWPVHLMVILIFCRQTQLISPWDWTLELTLHHLIIGGGDAIWSKDLNQSNVDIWFFLFLGWFERHTLLVWLIFRLFQPSISNSFFLLYCWVGLIGCLLI